MATVLLVNFINVDLSAFYLDFARCCFTSKELNPSNAVKYHKQFSILWKITKLLAPILPHTLLKKSVLSWVLKRKTVQLSEIYWSKKRLPTRRNLGYLVGFHIGLRGQNSKTWQARNEKVIGKSQTHFIVYPKWSCGLLGAIVLLLNSWLFRISSKDQLRRCSDVAFTNVHCWNLWPLPSSIQQLLNVTTCTTSVFTVQTSSKKTFWTQSQKEFETK